MKYHGCIKNNEDRGTSLNKLSHHGIIELFGDKMYYRYLLQMAK